MLNLLAASVALAALSGAAPSLQKGFTISQVETDNKKFLSGPMAMRATYLKYGKPVPANIEAAAAAAAVQQGSVSANPEQYDSEYLCPVRIVMQDRYGFCVLMSCARYKSELQASRSCWTLTLVALTCKISPKCFAGILSDILTYHADGLSRRCSLRRRLRATLCITPRSPRLPNYCPERRGILPTRTVAVRRESSTPTRSSLEVSHVLAYLHSTSTDMSTQALRRHLRQSRRRRASARASRPRSTMTASSVWRSTASTPLSRTEWPRSWTTSSPRFLLPSSPSP